MSKNGNFLNQALYKVNEIHMECLSELEHYIHYIMRCLGQNFDYDRLVSVHYENRNGISQAVVYPKESIIEGQGVVNPMFFYAYALEITEEGIQLWFTEDHKKFQEKY